MRRVIFAGTVLVCALACAAAQTNVLSIEKLAQTADVIVHGQVVSTTCQRDGSGRIVTRVELRPKEHWKGTSSNISIVHAGGVLGDEAVLADCQERYVAGEEVVAFLRVNGRGEGVTVGMCQGKFTVWKDGSETLAYSPFHGAGPAQREEATRSSLALETLKRAVQGGAP